MADELPEIPRQSRMHPSLQNKSGVVVLRDRSLVRPLVVIAGITAGVCIVLGWASLLAHLVIG
ncbi:hypothetical protein [Streptomyces albogriseolus]|uniref:hypothetical protein n=1 Tax=Streptomyces albogriseolus TaxID=1887 RepID=UPI0034604D9D